VDDTAVDVKLLVGVLRGGPREDLGDGEDNEKIEKDGNQLSE